MSLNKLISNAMDIDPHRLAATLKHLSYLIDTRSAYVENIEYTQKGSNDDPITHTVEITYSAPNEVRKPDFSMDYLTGGESSRRSVDRLREKREGGDK